MSSFFYALYAEIWILFRSLQKIHKHEIITKYFLKSYKSITKYE